jgi:hypothetical protein
MMFKNGMRPVHPGEVLREDFLMPQCPHGDPLQGVAVSGCPWTSAPSPGFLHHCPLFDHFPETFPTSS